MPRKKGFAPGKRNGNGANLGFEAKKQRLTAQLKGQFAESAELEKAIRENLKKVGYGF